jgi:hypothetical protein
MLRPMPFGGVAGRRTVPRPASNNGKPPMVEAASVELRRLTDDTYVGSLRSRRVLRRPEVRAQHFSRTGSGSKGADAGPV